MPLNLNDLFDLLAEEPTPDLPGAVDNSPARDLGLRENPHHFLLFLGTDTKFTKRPTAGTREYPSGETLSYLAQALTIILNEQASVKTCALTDTLSYSSASVDLLNGPKTLGAEVGERVAEGVLLALQAVARGKKTLQIAAHSRGAVEAILVMHELERIKKALSEEPEKKLYLILQSSPSRLTQLAMQTFFNTAKDDEANRRRLSEGLSNLKINAFLLDPVPGDTVFYLPGITWDDSLFYEKPPCDTCELLLARDERSAGFYPIIPKGILPKILPGHHGTASGNPYCQQQADLPTTLKNYQTNSVQKLVLFKLFYFLNNATGAIKCPENHQEVDLGHPALDNILNSFLTADDTKRQQLLLEHYTTVHKNDPAFLHFVNTTYRFLPKTTENGHRRIHYQDRTSKSMSILLTDMHQTFVNPEHAQYYLKGNGLDDLINAQEAEASEQVIVITRMLNNLFSEIKKDADGHRSQLVTMVSSTEGCESFFNALSIIVDSISQKYLRNNLSDREKETLLSCIRELFQMIKDAQPNLVAEAGAVTVITNCKDILQNGLKQTLEAHYTSILQKSKEIEQQVELFLEPIDTFKKAFSDFLNRLVSEDEDLTTLLASLKTQLSNLEPVLEPVNEINTVKKALLDAVEKLRVDQEKNNVAPSKREKLHMFLNEHSSKLLAYFQAHEHTIEDYLSTMENLAHAADSLQKAYPELVELADETNSERKQSELITRVTALKGTTLRLTQLAGTILKEKQYNLEQTKPDTVSKDFYDKAITQAIALGAISPRETKLAQEIAKLAAEREEHEICIETLDNQQKIDHKKLGDASRKINAQRMQIESLQKKMKETQAAQTAAATRISQRADELTSLTATQENLITTMKQEAAISTQKMTKQAELIAALEQKRTASEETATLQLAEITSLKKSMQEQEETLSSALEQATSEKNELKTQNEKLKSKVAEHLAEIKDNQEVIASLNQENKAQVEQIEDQKQGIKALEESAQRQVTDITRLNKLMQEQQETLSTALEQAKSENDELKTQNEKLNSNVAEHLAKIADNQEVIASLNQENKAQVKLIKDQKQQVDALVEMNQRQVTEISSLQEIITTMQEQISGLERLNAEKDSTIATLQDKQSTQAHAMTEKDQLINRLQQELDTTTVAHAKELETMQTSVQQRISELEQQLIDTTTQDATRAHMQQRINELEQQLIDTTTQDATRAHMQQLEATTAQDAIKASMQQRISELEQQQATAQETLSTTIEQTNKEKNELKIQNEKLNSKEEATCALLIHQKLKPLTEHYLHHLLVEAQNYLPTLDQTNYQQTLPASDKAGEEYVKIKNKFDKVQALYCQLNDKNVVMPSQRLEKFSALLKEYKDNEDLTYHRDPFWKAYFKSCLAVIAVIATGIIPGMLYFSVTGTSPLFFSKSRGEKYTDEIQDAVLANQI